MSILTPPMQFTPAEVERASEQDGKNYELVEGELKEKIVGTRALFIATRISERLNAAFFPQYGFAAVEAMTYCFDRPNHGRKPDVVFVRFSRLPAGEVPDGDIFIVPDVAVEVLSPGDSGIEIDTKLNEYLEAGIPLVWIVNPDGRTIRVYRSAGTTRLFHSHELIENEPLLPGFALRVDDVLQIGPRQIKPSNL